MIMAIKQLQVRRTIDPNEPQMVFRIITTTCPKCRKHVEFAINDGEYLQEEIDWYKKLVIQLEDELRTQKLLINKIMLGK